ncbi:MAG: peptidoglycan-binding protein [Xanthomonadaceae bacterium]|nr:peptidoglycan-binding protein [Xanthomonadaceae bacterium]
MIDANTFVYAYRAGGAELLDKYVRMAIMDDRKLAITRTVWGEIEKGPLGPDILSYVSERGLQVLEAKGTEAEVLADPRKRKNAGERSLLEVAKEEYSQGRYTRLWADDRYFDSPQIMPGHPGAKRVMSSALLDEAYEQGVVDAAEYRKFRAGYEAQAVFEPGKSPRLNKFRYAFPELDAAEIDEKSLAAPASDARHKVPDSSVPELPDHPDRPALIAAEDMDATRSATSVEASGAEISATPPARDAAASDAPEGARSVSQAGNVAIDSAQPGAALRDVATESLDSPRLASSGDAVIDLGAVSPDDAPRGHPHVRALGAGLAFEAAVTAYEWNETRQRAQVFLETLDNEGAAFDAYARQSAQTAGTTVGTVAGGLTATALGAGSGGTFLLVAGDAYLFGKAADRLVDLWEQDRVRTQKDSESVPWEFNGRQWLRGDLRADLADDGRDMAQAQSLAALPDKARELSARASAVSVEQVLGRVPVPRGPFVQPAGGSPDSGRWEYAAGRGVWEREVITAYDTNDRPSAIARVQADPEMAARLNAQAMQVVEANLRAGPAVIAAQYEIGHKARGYEQTVAGAQPPAVAKALDPDLLQASDGKHYRRDAEGTWMHEGVAAAPNRALELELGRERLLPALEQHRVQIAGMPTWQPPTPEQQDRDMLRHAYLDKGWNREALPEMFEASYRAVQRTRAETDVTAATTSLVLGQDANGQYSLESPIHHLRRDADGVVRIAAVTTPDDIALARADVRGHDRVEDARQQAMPERTLSNQVAAQASRDPDALRPGDQGDAVELLQYRLDRQGYRGADGAPIPQTGRYDAATEHAVRQFQAMHGLPATGIADAGTREAVDTSLVAQRERERAGSGVRAYPHRRRQPCARRRRFRWSPMSHTRGMACT